MTITIILSVQLVVPRLFVYLLLLFLSTVSQSVSSDVNPNMSVHTINATSPWYCWHQPTDKKQQWTTSCLQKLFAIYLEEIREISISKEDKKVSKN